MDSFTERAVMYSSIAFPHKGCKMLNKQQELFASEHIYIEQIFYKQAQYNKNTLCANPQI